ncbi:MAG: NAD(P)-binding protein [Byssovorax sp.]
MSSNEFLVVGAGISGLWAALLLARAGRAVRIIDRSARPGGLAGAERFRGVPCDLGSHRLHPEALSRPLFREIHAAAPFAERPRRGVLLFEGRRLPYPPAALPMLRALGPTAALALGLGLAGSAARRRALSTWEADRPGDGGDDLGFERFVKDRVGERAYASFYRPYAEKVWGLHPAELSQSVAKKRVSTSRPWALARDLLGKLAARIDGERTSADRSSRFVYPPQGIASIIDFLLAELRALGVTVEQGRAFTPDDARDRVTLYAGDLRDLVPTPLAHRGLYLVWMAFDAPRLGHDETYYSPDARHYFGRVSELQNYSPALRSPGETILCVEIPEGRWGSNENFTRGPRGDALLAQLAGAGLLPEGKPPIEVQQRFIPGVYPLYRRGWRAEWRAAMNRVASLRTVFPMGRQALFLHVNLDHCADIAEQCVAHVTGGGDLDGWLARAEGFLDIRVRD